MIGIFRQKTPANALILLFYALVLKFPLFLHPVTPALHPEDNYLYRVILQGLNSGSNTGSSNKDEPDRKRMIP